MVHTAAGHALHGVGIGGGWHLGIKELGVYGKGKGRTGTPMSWAWPIRRGSEETRNNR